jgi:serpin B
LILAVVALSLCFSTALTGCSRAADEQGADGQESGKQDVSKQDAAAEIVKTGTAKPLQDPQGNPNPNAQKAARGANDFAFRLGAELLKDIDGKCFVFSPYSVWLPLAALVSATDDANKDALLTALGTAGLTADDINSAASRMLYDLTKVRYQSMDRFHQPIQIANAVFVDDDVTLCQDFARMFMDFYRGNAMTVDFDAPETVDIINQWASDHTEGLITDLIKEGDIADAFYAIANAIYFSDRWAWEFNPDQTTEGVFHSPGGDNPAFFMLREGDGQYYYEDGMVQAIKLPFATGRLCLSSATAHTTAASRCCSPGS